MALLRVWDASWSNDLVILHVRFALFLDVLVESGLQEARIADAVIVLAGHALVSGLLYLGVDAATGRLLNRGAEASSGIGRSYGEVPLAETVVQHYLLELLLHRFDVVVVLVVARAEISFVVFDDVDVAVLGVLARHDLDLLLGLESLTAAVEGDKVLLLPNRILKLSLLLGDGLLEQLSLVVVNISELSLQFLVLRRLDREIVFDWICQILLGHKRHALHLLFDLLLLLLLKLPSGGASEDFWLAQFGGRILLVCHLKLTLDVPRVYLRTLKHL